MKKIKNFVILFSLFLAGLDVHAQEIFNALYPIGDNPSVGYKSNMVKNENILFEANPILRMYFYNNIRKKLMNNKDSERNHASTMYLAFRPQLRMYTDNSRPVKMPSYKISILGYQHIFPYLKTKHGNYNFFAFSLESGHYSNGQAKSAFDPNIDDGTPENDSLFNTITSTTNLSQKLNRVSGNFSTNYTELILNYRWIDSDLNESYEPKRIWSFKGGLNYYHNDLLFLADIGGYSESDIKIYGRYRFVGGIEYMHRLSEPFCVIKSSKCTCKEGCFCIDRFTYSFNFEYIATPHPFVNPLRTELTATVYFKNNVGLFVSYIYGHDNYNYRFVDSGHQFFGGLTFDIFPPSQIKK